VAAEVSAVPVDLHTRARGSSVEKVSVVSVGWVVGCGHREATPADTVWSGEREATAGLSEAVKMNK
jgi:hypothetical protein